MLASIALTLLLLIVARQTDKSRVAASCAVEQCVASMDTSYQLVPETVQAVKLIKNRSNRRFAMPDEWHWRHQGRRR